jgi:hypothetical protein
MLGLDGQDNGKQRRKYRKPTVRVHREVFLEETYSTR